MNLVKGNGEIVAYDPHHVRTNVQRTGASIELAQKVVDDIAPKIVDGMSTFALHNLVKASLQKQSTCYACRYDLRDALMHLGPAGFNFEFFIAEILNAHGYRAHVPPGMMRGACVEHEVDVVAEKDGRRMFIEAKFRNTKDDVVDLKDIMAAWSRFLDLVDGAALGYVEHFDECYIMTNARFTESARQFGECKGMHLIGWDYPKNSTLASLIDQRSLYPVTVIDDFSPVEIKALAEQKLLLCKKLDGMDPEELSAKIQVSVTRATEMIDLASRVVNGE
jgi:hypothetical protein